MTFKDVFHGIASAIVMVAIILLVVRWIEHMTFVDIKLQNIEDLLAEQNQLMEFDEEAYNEYCSENPEDCEETF